jgi:hypothetical protein
MFRIRHSRGKDDRGPHRQKKASTALERLRIFSRRHTGSFSYAEAASPVRGVHAMREF